MTVDPHFNVMVREYSAAYFVVGRDSVWWQFTAPLYWRQPFRRTR